MTAMKEKAVDIIRCMSEDKGSGRKLDPLAGGLVFMADDFDETPDCFREYNS